MQLKACALVAALSWSLFALPASAAQVEPLKNVRASAQSRDVSGWIVRNDDARGRPYAIVDKKAARLYLFDGQHRLLGATTVLLGQTVGDDSTPGVGQRAQVGRVGLNERTTPAGRFDSVPGRNLDGEDIVWLDYEAAFAIHRLRPGSGLNDRLKRLRSATPADNRASWGCVVVPLAFYLDVIQPVLGKKRGVVYVLPETRAHEGIAPDV